MTAATHAVVRLSLLLAAGWLLALAARGQCSTTFLPGDGAPGTNGPVHTALLWDADGAGPEGPRLVLGGAFTVAGDALARNVASRDLATGAWSPFGAGLDGEVAALVVAANGALVAAANATTPASTNRVLAWNGAAWVQLGGAFDGAVHCMLALPGGDLVVGGAFTTVGGAPVTRLARWNGLFWRPFGTGVDGIVRALTTMPNGDLVIGGSFATVAGQPANCIARWNGATWSPLGSGIPPIGIDGPYALAVLPGGDLVAAGFFPAAGGTYVGNIARWDGAAWHALGAGLNTDFLFSGSARSLLVLSNGDLVVGGRFTAAGGGSARAIARWNGTLWRPIGPGFQPLSTFQPANVAALVELPGGEIVAAGTLRSIGGTVGEYVSSWDSVAWRALARGFDGPVRAIAEAQNGDVIAAGAFTVAGGVAANRVARWDGVAWTALGSGVNNIVNAAVVLPGGDLVVGGAFTIAGGVVANRVARWNGATWSPMGGGMGSAVTALELLPNGDLIAGGTFTTADGQPAARLARWTGTGWVELAGGITNGINPFVTALHVRPDGTLIVGGRFTAAGATPVTNIAAWDGAVWTPLGSAPELPSAITTALGGAIVASHSSYVSQWGSGQWTPLGLGATGNVLCVAPLPDGDVLAVGGFDQLGGPPFVNTIGVGRFGAGAWSAVDGGLGDGFARVVRVLRDGDIAIGGEFFAAGGDQSPWFARLRSNCPATIAPLGAGCAGAGGGNVLAVRERAWRGGTFRARSTGIVMPALVVAATGFSTTALPLASVLPAAPGCTLFASPDLLDVVVAAGGVAELALAIPDTAALVGQTFHHQHVPFELDAAMALTTVSATNAVTATIGAL